MLKKNQQLPRILEVAKNLKTYQKVANLDQLVAKLM